MLINACIYACQPRTKSDCTLNIVRICTAFVNVKCKWASLLSEIRYDLYIS